MVNAEKIRRQENRLQLARVNLIFIGNEMHLLNGAFVAKRIY